MAFTYTSDDLRRWLRADPQFSREWGFVLDQMARLGHSLTVERLIGRDFQGGIGRASVDTKAANQNEAAAWARDALRAWAWAGCMPVNPYFMNLAREWAITGPGTNSTAKSLGSTLDFLTLLSGNGSLTSFMLPAASLVSTDVGNVFCWIYSDRLSATQDRPIITAAHLGARKVGQGPPGLNRKYWDSDGDGNVTTDSDDDQSHHFAGYFQFGMAFGAGTHRLHLALSNTGDWSIMKGKVLNKGDYDLGFLAAQWGEKYSRWPRFIGKDVEADLT